MSEPTTAMRASQALVDRKDELAREITETMYAERPTLLERYGDAGRAKCLQDMRYSLEHLAPAVALEDPSMFTRYVTWLVNLLAARGVGTEDVRHSLESMLVVLASELDAPAAAAALPSVRAGLESLASDCIQ